MGVQGKVRKRDWNERREGNQELGCKINKPNGPPN